jgi:HopA1 effector protein family
MLDTTALLQDIAAQIQIGADFTLRHPDYPDWETAEVVVDRLQASPQETQAKFICTQLQAYLHCIYFSRSLLPLSTISSSAESSAAYSNNSSRGIDTAFYDQIEQANSGQGYYDPDWTIQAQPANGCTAVSKEGLCIQVQSDDVYPPQPAAQIGSQVAIKLPKNLLTVEQYIAVGNQGRVYQNPLVYLYFNCPPQSAINLTAQITQIFNRLEIPFELQILLHPEQYPRADALTLKWAAENYDTVYPYLNQMLATYQGEFHDFIPALSQPVTKGVGKAIISTEQNFPQQFWRLVAQALSQAWLARITDTVGRLNIIQQELQSTESYLNNA